MNRTTRALVAVALCAAVVAYVTAAPAPAIPAAKAAQGRLLDVAVAGERAVAVGQHGVILTSADGAAWEQRASPVSTMLTRVRFTDDRTGWALGWDATILQTQDAGATWTLRHYDEERGALFDLLFLDAQHGLAVGAYGALLETTDGGATWSPREGLFGELGMHVNALLRLPTGTLVAAGERGLVAFSTDSGGSWQLLDTPYGGSWFGAIPHGETGVVVFGMRGNVFVADDVTRCAKLEPAKWDPYTRQNFDDAAEIAARGWRRIPGTRRDSIYGALALGPDAALLVGFNGAMQKLDAAAGTLTPVPSGASETLVKLASFRGRLLAVGRRGAQDLGAIAEIVALKGDPR